MPRWFFNADKNECQSFIYSESATAATGAVLLAKGCAAWCHNRSNKPARRTAPGLPGTGGTAPGRLLNCSRLRGQRQQSCFATKRPNPPCVLFVHAFPVFAAGCGVNANNFLTEKACQAQCM